MRIELAAISYGEPSYEPIVAPLRADRTLADLMWRHAESRWDDRPGDRLILATVDGVPAAWRLLRPTIQPLPTRGWSAVILARIAYVRPGYRVGDIGVDVYEQVHHATQQLIEEIGCVAQSWVYERPRQLMLRDGWRDMPGEHGISTEVPGEPHEWWGMEWRPKF